MSDCACHDTLRAAPADTRRRRTILAVLLAVNALMCAVELGAGWWAHSSALTADAVDMFMDAVVYAISLYALDRTARARAAAGLTNGLLELVLAAGVLTEVGFHALGGVTPLGPVMLATAALALLANVGCAALLLRYRADDVNMRAVWLCTRNDALGNAGTLAAGALVLWLSQAWPDLLVGTALALLFIRTSLGVIHEAWGEWRRPLPMGN